MLTNGEDPNKSIVVPMQLARTYGNGPEAAADAVEEEASQLASQNDAHFQVFHRGPNGKETMFCGIAWQFAPKELSLVLATKDYHIYSGDVDLDVFVSFLCDCVLPNATMPLSVKTNFGYPADFKNIELFRSWIKLNLTLVLQMKSLWSGRTNIPTFFHGAAHHGGEQHQQELSTWKRVTDLMF